MPSARCAGVFAGMLLAFSTACDKPAAEPYVRLSAPAPALSPAPPERAVLLTFWATWCNFCREESDELRRLAADPPSGLAVVVMSEDESFDDVKRFFGGAIPPELHLRLDDDWRVAHSLFVHQLPASVLVVDGNAVARFDGARSWSGAAARSTLARLLKGAEHPSSTNNSQKTGGP